MFSLSPYFGVSQGWDNEVKTPSVPSRFFKTNALSKRAILEHLTIPFRNQVCPPCLPTSTSVAYTAFEEFVRMPFPGPCSFLGERFTKDLASQGFKDKVECCCGAPGRKGLGEGETSATTPHP